MVVNGCCDLLLVFSARVGFEMSVLRMLAFRPADSGQVQVEPAVASSATSAAPASSVPASAAVARESVAAPMNAVNVTATPAVTKVEPPAAAEVSVPWKEEATAPAPVAAPEVKPPALPEPPAEIPVASGFTPIASAEDWLQFAASSGMKGAARQLAENAAFVGYGNGVLQLSLEGGFDYLRSERSLAELSSVLAAKFGAAPKIVFDNAATASETLQQRTHRQRDARQSAAEENFMNNPDVQRLIQQHGAKVVPDSIRPLDEN